MQQRRIGTWQSRWLDVENYLSSNQTRASFFFFMSQIVEGVKVWKVKGLKIYLVEDAMVIGTNIRVNKTKNKKKYASKKRQWKEG